MNVKYFHDRNKTLVFSTICIFLLQFAVINLFNMPVLLKKYLKLNGRIVSFNIDPKFNNALDGLLVLDLFDVPVDTISSLSKEINDDSIMERFSLHDPKSINHN